MLISPWDSDGACLMIWGFIRGRMDIDMLVHLRLVTGSTIARVLGTGYGRQDCDNLHKEPNYV